MLPAAALTAPPLHHGGGSDAQRDRREPGVCFLSFLKVAFGTNGQGNLTPVLIKAFIQRDSNRLGVVESGRIMGGKYGLIRWELQGLSLPSPPLNRILPSSITVLLLRAGKLGHTRASL